LAVSINDGKVFNDSNPWEQIILKDIVSVSIYEVSIDEFNQIHLESSTEELTTRDIPDISTSLIYQLFSYNEQIHIAPTLTIDGKIFGSECLVNVGNTIIMKVFRDNDVITPLGDISVHIYDQVFDTFIFLDVEISQVEENEFKVEFITPVKGDFLVILKVGETVHLTKRIFVNEYSYNELNSAIDTAIEALNNDKYQAYI